MHCQNCDTDFWVEESTNIKHIKYCEPCKHIVHKFQSLANTHRYRSGVAYGVRPSKSWIVLKDTCEGGEMAVGALLSREDVQNGLQYDAFTDGTQLEHCGRIYEVCKKELIVIQSSV